jgi:hypothetical protein
MLCTDTGAYSPNVNNFCDYMDGDIIDGSAPVGVRWYQSLGGIGGNPNSDVSNPISFTNSEYGNNYKQGQECCGSNDNLCNYDCPPQGTNSTGLFVQKIANYGDPLQCCLRDFQCNEGSNNDIHGASCFSDNSGTNTCPSSFRATDTVPCQFLTTQYCLGNIGDSIDPTTDLDFTALWTDTTSELATPDYGGNFRVYSLPIGYKYKLNENWAGSYNDNDIQYPKESTHLPYPSLGICQLDPNTGLPVDKTKNNISSCPRNATVTVTNPAIPYNTENAFNFQGLPPCQAIFWRTLYGNEPEFQNQYWRNNTTQTCPPDPVTGEARAACETSSNAPQGAACSASPFAGIPTPSGVDWAKNTLTAAVNKIKAINGQSILTPYNLQTNAPFFGWLYSVCSSYPYLCADFLETECSTVTQELLDNSPGVRNWCGCYLPDSFYDTVY